MLMNPIMRFVGCTSAGKRLLAWLRSGDDVPLLLDRGPTTGTLLQRAALQGQRAVGVGNEGDFTISMHAAVAHDPGCIATDVDANSFAA